MDGIRDYFISITTAAVLCAIINGTQEKGTSSQKIVKLICGLFLTFTVIRPVTHIQLIDISFLTDSVSQEAQEAINAGEAYLHQSLSAIIKNETEAYILDKAKTLQATPDVEVILSNSSQPIPKEVYIKGDVPPLTKKKLQEIIEEDLGIAKENQIWIR